MPYCPKCDMEFIDGITVCSDCKGPLVESEAVAKAMRKKEKEDAMLRERAMMEELMKADGLDEYMSVESPEGGSAERNGEEGEAPVDSRTAAEPPVRVYVDKAKRYEDLKSSASAFLLVGGLLLVFSILCWSGIISLPMYGISKLIFQGALTVMGIFSLGVYMTSSRSARQLAPEIDAEKHQTEELIAWFRETYSAEGIDSQIPDRGELSEEELSLKRFQIIQDYFITGKDLPDPAYVDALCEEVYARLYE